MKTTIREINTDEKKKKTKLFIGMAYDHFSDDYAVVNKESVIHKVVMLNAGELVGESEQYYMIRSVNRDLTNPNTEIGDHLHFLMKCAIIEKIIVEVDFDIEEILKSIGIEVFDKRITEQVKYVDVEMKEDGSNESASDYNAGKSD
jgi:hypothetical protein